MRRIGYVLSAALIPLVCHATDTTQDSCGVLAAMEASPPRVAEIGEGECSSFLNISGQEGVSCAWEFEFRSKLAEQKAEELWSLIQSCRAGYLALGDQPVNHPDSYVLREWVGDLGSYRVSIKDKGAQGRTLVFLRYR